MTLMTLDSEKFRRYVNGKRWRLESHWRHCRANHIPINELDDDAKPVICRHLLGCRTTGPNGQPWGRHRRRWGNVSRIRYVDELGPYRVVRAPFFVSLPTPRQGTRQTGLVVEFTAKDRKERRTYTVFRKPAADAADPTYWIRIGRPADGEKFFLRPPVKVEE